MASFNHISGAEPSTVTFKLATVTQTRNSSAMHQEILSIGDPESSLGLAAVLASAPPSTTFALAVRPVGTVPTSGDSTVFQGSSAWQVQVTNQARVGNSTAADFLTQISGNSTVAPLAGSLWTIQGNSTVAPLAGSTWNVRPIQSSAADLQATVTQASTVWAVQLTQYSTIVTVSSLGGAVIVRSSKADALVSVYQSSAAELQATVTPVAGSTWRTQPGSTAWASSAGFHFDSSGGLQISGAITGSTLSTGFLAVRITDGSTWVTDYAQGSTFTAASVGGGVNFLRIGQSSASSTDTFVMGWASTAGAQIIATADSSGAIAMVGDAVNNAIRVNVVAGAAAGSTIVTISTGSVRVHQSTASDFQATVAQASTVWAVQLTQYSTIVAISSLAGAVIMRSSKADALVSVYQSSASELQATVTPAAGSTWSVRPLQSSAADLQVTCTPLAGSTWNVRVLQSSAADLQATVTQAGTWTVNVGTHIQSSAAPSSNSSGVVVRQVIDNLLTTASTNAFGASTTLSIQSSGASLRSYVTAYSITSTVQAVTKVAFYSSGVMLAPVVMAALSSAFAGVNLAVSPPGYLFRTIGAADALSLNTGNAAIAGFKVWVSYFRAP